MGDLSCVMPIVQPYSSGAVGTPHGNDYYIVDPIKACVGSAKWQLAMLKILLSNDAKRAYEVIKNFKPRFSSKKEFLDYCDAICCDGDRIEYSENTAIAKI
jgi:hypothetical protein